MADPASRGGLTVARAKKPKASAAEPLILPLGGAPEPGAWPADHVERRPLAELIPYARNARTHSATQIAQLAESIRQWGWTIPILCDEDGGIIAGHGRALAAQKLRIAEVPVMVARGWTDAQRRAYVLADNQLAINAGWDEGLLSSELGALNLDGFSLTLAGFSLPELKALDIDGFTGGDGTPARAGGVGSLAERFGIPPFTVLSAREGWWQDRKRAWLAIGIQSELGRGAAPGGAPMPMDRAANATPGGGARPAATNYANGARGDGRGRAAAA